MCPKALKAEEIRATVAAKATGTTEMVAVGQIKMVDKVVVLEAPSIVPVMAMCVRLCSLCHFHTYTSYKSANISLLG